MKPNVLSKAAGFIFLSATAFLLSSCGSTFMVAADDVYGTVPTREQERSFRQQDQSVSHYETYAQESSQQYGHPAPTDTFNYDDYYDYEYTSRLRRFHEDDYLSDDYYSDYYTNTYWYDANPYYYGTSIYLGYNWWYPSYTCYRPGWYLGFSYGPFSFGWGGWPYYSYYWPEYGWGYSNGYWNGYWDGYYNGYWHEHCYDYCYNPYDRNTYTQSQYGKRISGGSSVTRPVVAGASTGMQAQNSGRISSDLATSSRNNVRVSFPERYEKAMSASSSVSGSSTRLPSNTGSGIRVSQTSLDRHSSVQSGTGKIENTSLTDPSVRKPSNMIDNVSKRLATKQTNYTSSVSSAGSRTGNTLRNPTDGKAASSTIRVQQNAANRTSGSQGMGTSASPQRTNPYRNASNRNTATSRPQQTGNPQPRQYSTPVYNRSRSTSSYVSPQYNNSTRNMRTANPARTSATSRPASISTSRTTNSSVSRTTATRSTSTGSSSSRRTR